MAFKTIDLDRFVAVAALTKAVGAPDYTVISRAGVTLDAVLQTVLAVADALVHCFIALFEKHLHVVFAHPLGFFHALSAFADIKLGHTIAFRGSR
jgi:hypothetical protein